jgi:hypothetical protein
MRIDLDQRPQMLELAWRKSCTVAATVAKVEAHLFARQSLGHQRSPAYQDDPQLPHLARTEAS